MHFPPCPLQPRACPVLTLGPLRLLIVALAMLLPLGSAAKAQEAPTPGVGTGLHEAAPRVYLDCRRCDFAHIRQEIPFVDYVREPEAADLHVLVTDERTGAGGRRYNLDFLGRGGFRGVENRLTYTSAPTATRAEERDGITEMLKLGLVPYVARTALAPGLRLSWEAPETEEVRRPAEDPWRNWTFEVYGGGNFSTESNRGAWNARYGFYANRVTEDWKIRVRPYFNHNHRFVRHDDEDIRLQQRRHGVQSYVIRSLGAHFGAGIFGDYITTTIDNLNHGLNITPAVEYSFFPYEEASRRQITLTYRLGYEFADYIEETIYEQTEETLLTHALTGAVEMQQPWGSISSSLTGSHYFHDVDNHRITFDGNVSYRLGGGVSLNVGGTYQRINDQLSLPRGDASLEDVLLERRRLATTFRGTGRIGLSYTFGSIFTNVVNPRL